MAQIERLVLFGVDRSGVFLKIEGEQSNTADDLRAEYHTGRTMLGSKVFGLMYVKNLKLVRAMVDAAQKAGVR